MTLTRIWSFSAVIMSFLFLTQTASAQGKEFWPEVGMYVNLNEKTRLYFSAAITNDQGDRSDADFGASIDFHIKPLSKLVRAQAGRLDQSKSRLLLLRGGYHYIPSRSGSTENRLVLEAVGRYPLTAGSVVTLRGRFELRSIDGDFSRRYRIRPGIERSFAIIRDYRITPYARAEFYHDSISKKWGRTALTAGCVFPIRKRSEIEAYFEHQNRTEKSPNNQVNAIGLQVNLYLR